MMREKKKMPPPALQKLYDAKLAGTISHEAFEAAMADYKRSDFETADQTAARKSRRRKMERSKP